MQTSDFRMPGILSAKELLVAEAVQARAWEALAIDMRAAGGDMDAAKARLGGIVLRMMSDRTRSIGDLAAVAVEAFREAAKGRP